MVNPTQSFIPGKLFYGKLDAIQTQLIITIFIQKNGMNEFNEFLKTKFEIWVNKHFEFKFQTSINPGKGNIDLLVVVGTHMRK